MFNPVSFGMSMTIATMATIGMMYGIAMIPETAMKEAKLTPAEKKRLTQEKIDYHNEHCVR